MTTLAQMAQGKLPPYADLFRYIGMPNMIDPNLSAGSQQQGAPYTVRQGYYTTEQQGGGEGGTQEVQVWHPPELIEAADVPDQYKGIVKYDPNVVGKEGRNDVFALNKEMLAKYPATKFGDVSQVVSLGFGDQPTDWAQGVYGNKVANKNAIYYDPNYGWITSKYNLYDPERRTDSMIQAAMMAGLGFGGGYLGMPALASSAVGAARTIGSGGGWQSALVNILPGLIGSGFGGQFQLPDGLAQAIKLGKVGYGGYNAAKRNNPGGMIGSGLSLAQLLGFGGG